MQYWHVSVNIGEFNEGHSQEYYPAWLIVTYQSFYTLSHRFSFLRSLFIVRFVNIKDFNKLVIENRSIGKIF